MGDSGAMANISPFGQEISVETQRLVQFAVLAQGSLWVGQRQRFGRASQDGSGLSGGVPPDRAGTHQRANAHGKLPIHHLNNKAF
jgi:hypothetical protein